LLDNSVKLANNPLKPYHTFEDHTVSFFHFTLKKKIRQIKSHVAKNLFFKS